MKKKEAVGIIGLGKMGAGIAQKFLRNKITVYGHDRDEKNFDDNFFYCDSIEKLVLKSTVIFLLLPAGDLIDQVLEKTIGSRIEPGTTPSHGKRDLFIIDGGNSFYQDSIRRYNFCKKNNINFLDVGISGGVHGLEHGYSLMIGGERESYLKTKKYFELISAPNGFVYTGDPGSGHYTKMVHNGIEYGIMQAYAEGLNLLHDGYYKNLDLAEITQSWQHGSVIRSWLLELTGELFAEIKSNPELLKNITGVVEENGTGQWTYQEAQRQNKQVPVLKKSLDVRSWSRETGGDMSTKILALMRNKFGGHRVINSENHEKNS